MDLIKFSIKNPIAIIVSVLLVMIFGLISLNKLPYQLTPSVMKPEIKITTHWAGATPHELEREVIEEQENVLKSLNNLVKYESSSKDNFSVLTLTFKLGTDIRLAMQDVSNKLNEVSSYPEDVKEPIIETASSLSVIWLMLQTLEGNPNHIDEYKTFFDDEIKPLIKRVNGVSATTINGGRKKQMEIVFNTNKLASYGLTINKVINTLKNENVDISSGILNLGRRAYRVRSIHKFKTIEDIEKLVLLSNREQRVKVSDIAKVQFGYETPTSVAKYFDKDAIFLGVKTNPSSNLVEMTNEVEKLVNRLNEQVLKEKGLKIRWLYDQRPYIIGSVELIQKNIIIGACLAIMMLILFLRAISPTAVVSVAIPISIIATFIILESLGRSLNTISLAGISFAIGMLVDSAIVVLENIDRHRKEGKSISEAAYIGTKEVWGALIASVLTTIAVFLPIIFLEDEAGQLFKDIAIAVTTAVIFSLFVSITVIPMLWQKFASFSSKKTKKKGFLASLGMKAVDGIMYFVSLSLKNIFTKLITITALVFFSIVSIYLLFPKLDYLPKGNKNLIFNILMPPPGLSYEERYEMGDYLMNSVKVHLNKDIDGVPGINRIFYLSKADFTLFGATSMHEDRATELIPMFKPIINSIPSVFGVSLQSGVFDSDIGKGNSVDIDISGEKIEDIVAVGGKLFGELKKTIKGAQVRPIPSIELIYPEVRISPDQDALKAVGLSSSQFGIAIDSLMSGRKVGDFEEEGKKKIDLILKASQDDIQTPQDIMSAQIVLPNYSTVLVSSLASYKNTTGITAIRHFNGKRTITLKVTPPQGMTIAETMEVVNIKLNSMKKDGKISNKININISGTADKLSQTIDLLSMNFLLAVLIIYLLMSALFKNFLYPIVILFTVPLATAGGFIGLKLTNHLIAPQPLDILTILGFIILTGIVVNNAILIVHQSLNYIKNEGMQHKKAVIEATRTRIRPIYMSSLTSIFGMIPLVFIPGPGSEFYRGLGSVITGGLAFSTIFTIFITPALLMLFMRLIKLLRK